ncbi:hypothetical protein GGP85_002952 [Salinibacter ruber]|uniref:glycosyltransferase family 2 protein n=1 Tax=Salinibacter ruber TaxID=146919 RepID=UPI00216A2AA3|nr:glycosyltransferase [Salinibacter ruber]MCS3827482.1 hypothetical protein [Salinibacter ruber]
MSLSISVLITNYNAWPDAATSARAVMEHCGEEVSRILIMDDASDNDPPSLPDEVEVKRHRTNQGFPATLNDGFDELKEDVVVHFDADGHPLMNFVPPVVEAFSHNEQLGALGFHMVDYDGNPTGSYTAASEISVLRFLLGQRLSQVLNSNSQEDLLLPNACGTAVRREAFCSVGGFDEAFELLNLDLDFFLRLDREGWDVEYAPKILAYHEGGGTPQTTATRVIRYHRDRWHLLLKHADIRQPAVERIILGIRHSIEYIILSMFGNLIVGTKEEKREKIKGRNKLIKRVWNDYKDSTS